MRIRENNQNWTATRNISHLGENRHPVFSTGFESPVLWEYRQAGDWNLKFYSIDWEDTASIRFSHQNETNPCGLTVPQITDQFAPMLIAFQSDSGGNPDIYSHTMPFDYLYSYNISLYPGPDINPCFSGPAWGEAMVYHVRYWVAWEREKPAGNQIWGSYSEMAFGEIDPGSNMTLDQISLQQNYPNPFNNQTVIRFYIPKMTVVKIDIFDIVGRKIKNLLGSPCPAGEHSVFWDGRDEQGRDVASGIYFSRLTSGRSVITRKMMILR